MTPRLGNDMSVGGRLHRGTSAGGGGGLDLDTFFTERWIAGTNTYENVGASNECEDGDDVLAWRGSIAPGPDTELTTSFASSAPHFQSPDAIDFDGSDHFLRFTHAFDGPFQGNHHSVHLVVDVQSPNTTNQRLIRTPNWQLFIDSGAGGERGFCFYSVATGFQGVGFLSSGKQLLSLELDAGTSGGLYVNDVLQEGTFTYAGTSVGIGNVGVMANNDGNSSHSDGLLYELSWLSSTTAIDANDRAAARAALITEHGI